jgi:flagellin FlaB
MNLDSGFTGLEAAIVLIAFIVVAAVFSYLVLGSGILATQSARDTVHTSVNGIGSSLYVSGNIYGVRTTLTSPPTVRSILIPLRVLGNGVGVNMTDIQVSVISESNREELTLNRTFMNVAPGSGRWSIQKVITGDCDTILEDGEEFLVNATLSNTGDMVPYHQFSIEFSPTGGTPLRVTRTIPSALYALNNLE